jgi:hypothetical protein
MAQFDISTDRLTDANVWPDCCARCGASGTTLVALSKRAAKNLPGVQIPFCEKHRDDIAIRARRHRIGVAVVLLGMPATAIVTWVLHPFIGGQFAGNDNARLMSAVLFCVGSAFPLGILALFWAKTPVRVVTIIGRIATVGGVGANFREAMLNTVSRSSLPDAPEEVTFDVTVYRPNQTTPLDTGGLLFGAAVVAGALLGALTAVAGLRLAPDALGIDRYSWWYVLACAGPIAVVGWVMFGPSSLFRPIPIFMSILVGFLFSGIVAIIKLLTFSPYLWFAAVYSFAPLVALQTLVLYPIIWSGRVRHGVLAGACGAVAPLLYAGAVYVVAGMQSGPQSAALLLGPIAALILAGTSYATATTPYCGWCDGWLTKRRIGAFALTRADVEPAVAGGEIVSLAGEKPYSESTKIGDVELTCYSCDSCADKGTVVVELFDCVKGGKNGTTPNLKRVDRYLYPGPALLVLNRMFPPPDEPKKAGAGE